MYSAGLRKKYWKCSQRSVAKYLNNFRSLVVCLPEVTFPPFKSCDSQSSFATPCNSRFSFWSLCDESPPRERKTISILRSLRLSVSSPQAGEQVPTPAPEDVIPTLSEGSELSFCMGDHSSDSENGDSYEDINPNPLNHTYQNVDPSLENSRQMFESEPE